MLSLRLPTVFAFSLISAACGQMPSATLDGGSRDGSVTSSDAGKHDGGVGSDGGSDAGVTDAGFIDAPVPDGGLTDGGALSLDGGCPGDGKSPANAVRNGGFECGTSSWETLGGVLDTVADAGRSGRFAGRVRSLDGGQVQVISDQPIVSSTSGKTYCARAHMRGDAGDTEFGVFCVPSNQQRAFFAPANSATWLAAPRQDTLVLIPGVGEQLYVRFFMKPSSSNETLFVDDIEVWESPQGQCTER